MKTKRILSILLALAMAVGLCGCTVIHGKLKVEIKDKNGDDTGLAVIKDSDICANDYESYLSLIHI